MPVTLQISDVAPLAWKPSTAASSVAGLFAGTSQKESNRSKRIIQSSFSNDVIANRTISPSNNGLVYTLYTAWSGHHHLTLRPEDIWFAILSQLNFYINAHAEELRSFFVAHEGQKDLEVIEAGTIATVDFGKLAERMTHLMQKNVLDEGLREWVIPSFSTTTTSDRVVASILMMGALQKYFSYTMRLDCGIPSVTLLGEKRDWELLLGKLGRIPQLGAEPALFARLLEPVLGRFVQSFDTPRDQGIIGFWNRVAHRTGGSGTYYFSGWVTAFCFWDEDGKSLYGDPYLPVSWECFEGNNAGCELDGVLYHRVDTEKIPAGFASVPVKLDDNGKMYDTRMLAGSVGMQGTSSGQMLDERLGSTASNADEATGPSEIDSLQPVSGWWMYEVESEEDVRRRGQLLEAKKAEMNSMGDFSDYKYGSDEYSRYFELWSEVSELEAF